MSTTQNGKGSARRPGKPGAYEQNYDKIVWKNREHPEGLACPRCGGHRMEVVYVQHRDRMIRRLRNCKSCNRRFVTMETLLRGIRPPDLAPAF